ncbi:MAG: hypothetical protein KGM98_06680 [Bacteroidota bacterium]|nr:hypothetical protein [Bacteroidota bacterium]
MREQITPRPNRFANMNPVSDRQPDSQYPEGRQWLPKSIIRSPYLKKSHLALLGAAGEIPAIDPSFEDPRLREIFQYYSLDPQGMEKEIHLYAGELLDKGQLTEAWQVLRTVV